MGDAGDGERGSDHMSMVDHAFVDPNAALLYVPTDHVNEVAKREDAIPYDAAGAELTPYR